MSHHLLKTLSFAIVSSLISLAASAQAMYFNNARVGAEVSEIPADTVPEPFTGIYTEADSIVYDTVMVMSPLPDVFFAPAVYDTYEFPDTVSPFTRDYSGKPEMRWLEEQNSLARKMKNMQRSLFFENPRYVRYNITMLPEAPKAFHAVVNPEDHTIEIRETPIDVPAAPTIAAAPVKRRHWIRTFNASLQFSQAYVSPNWYQGGNNNLNMLANIFYNVKLNQEFHPNLLFETTAQYKLGMNSAPDDTIHNYSISDDLFQVNTTFGIKAAKRWYYSFTGQFKTQLLNSYNSNSTTLRSAFLSPAELTLGVGMTYNYANAKKSFTFDASIAPLSYNMKTCINDRIDAALYGIEEGRKVVNNFGSSAELKLYWKICYNIAFTSRLFAFTDYNSAQMDWENTLAFEINRFLTTQIYAHARYDTATPACDDPSWKKLQVKEILSI